MDSRSNLYAALVQAQTIAKAVLKDSRNKFHDYKYASAEDMIAEARDALSSADLAFFPVNHRLITATSETEEDKVRVDYLLVHGTGESLEIKSETPVMPEKGRPLDKALATALTYNLGYTLRGLLLLPRVEKDANVDGRDDRNHTPRRQQAGSQSATAAPGRANDAQAAEQERETAQKAALKEELAAFRLLFGVETYRVVIGGKPPEDTVESLQAALAKCHGAQAMRVEQQIMNPTEAAQSTESPPPSAASPPLRVVPPEDKATSVAPAAKQEATKEASKPRNGKQPATETAAPAQEGVRTVSPADLSAIVRRLKMSTKAMNVEIEACTGKTIRLDQLSPTERVTLAEHLEKFERDMKARVTEGLEGGAA